MAAALTLDLVQTLAFAGVVLFAGYTAFLNFYR
jgi:hypothetical protein